MHFPQGSCGKTGKGKKILAIEWPRCFGNIIEGKSNKDQIYKQKVKALSMQLKT